MDRTRRRLGDDLRGLIRGDADADPATCCLFASDASVYQQMPLAVVRPRSAADVAAVMKYADDRDLSVHPRGAGSGIAGESLGRGIVVDPTRYMNRVTVSRDGRRVTADAGASLADVGRALAARGHRYGPDPITRSFTTIGGVVARDAAGSHYLRSGSARDTIVRAETVLADGRRLTMATHDVDDGDDAGRLALGLSEIEQQHASAIAAASVTPVYRLDDYRDEDGRVSLAKFIAGSQGTLAAITSVTLQGEPIPTHRGVVLLFYPTLDAAIRGSADAIDQGVVAADWMDRRLMQIVCKDDAEIEPEVPDAAEAMLLVEIQGNSLGDLYDRLGTLRSNLSRGIDGALHSIETVDDVQRDRFWRLYRRAVPRLFRLRGDQAPQPFVEDLRLPPGALIAAIAEIQAVLRDEGTSATMFGQAGRGSLHLRPFLDLSDHRQRRVMASLSTRIAETVWRHGGQVAANHAVGLAKSWMMPRQHGDLWPAMGQVKRLFDPNNRLHPGKVVAADPPRVNEDLRPSDRQIEVVRRGRVVEEADEQFRQQMRSGGRVVSTLPVLQSWPPGGEVSRVARACNGCGRCRTTSADQRQCPVFRAYPSEEATPRAKANLMRAVVSGVVPVDTLSTDHARAIADLCFNCHQCRLDCPASVDIPKIVGEIKAQHVAAGGQSIADRFVSRIDGVAGLGGVAPRLTNWLMRSAAARFVLQRTVGLSAARRLPPLATKTFLKHAAGRRWTRPNPAGGLKVCYFVDHYANHHEPEIGLALAKVLQHNGIGLFVPPRQVGSGMNRITMGDIPAARKIARRNVRVLVDAVRQGYEILVTEPAAALCLTHEYPNLLGNEDAIVVAEHTHEATAYLWHLHEHGRLSTEFQSVRRDVAHHQPCHSRVLNPHNPTPRLLSLIDGLNVAPVEAGCSGMAGTWGLLAKNYRASLRIGRPLTTAMRRQGSPTATAGCAACRMQLEHAAGKRTVHPITLLAEAYGD